MNYKSDLSQCVYMCIYLILFNCLNYRIIKVLDI